MCDAIFSPNQYVLLVRVMIHWALIVRVDAYGASHNLIVKTLLSFLIGISRSHS